MNTPTKKELAEDVIAEMHETTARLEELTRQLDALTAAQAD